MLKSMKNVCGVVVAAGAVAGVASAQDVTLTVQGPASANPGDVVTVEVVASVTGLPAGGAIGGYGLDLDVTSGGSLVSAISGATSNVVLDLGILPGMVNGSSLERAVAGQLPNVNGLNPGVDQSTTLPLFTVDLTIDAGATTGSIDISADVAAGTGGVVLFPDAAAGANVIAPASAGTCLSVVPLTITIGSVACPGDADGDGVVNGADLFIVLGGFGTTTANGAIDGDVNGDTFVNGADLFEVLGAFGTSCP